MGLVCSGRDAGLESDPFRLLAFGCFLPFGDDDGVCPDAAALDFAIPIPTPGGLVTHPHLFSIIGTFHAFRLPQPDNRCPGLWKMIGISYERSQHPQPRQLDGAIIQECGEVWSLTPRPSPRRRGEPERIRTRGQRAYLERMRPAPQGVEREECWPSGRGNGRSSPQGAVWASERRSPGVEDRLDWSGREDLNLRPPQPHCGALPGCATPRRIPTVPYRQTRVKRRRQQRQAYSGLFAHPYLLP
jgi:hypothetical protein